MWMCLGISLCSVVPLRLFHAVWRPPHDCLLHHRQCPRPTSPLAGIVEHTQLEESLWWFCSLNFLQMSRSQDFWWQVNVDFAATTLDVVSKYLSFPFYVINVSIWVVNAFSCWSPAFAAFCLALSFPRRFTRTQPACNSLPRDTDTIFGAAFKITA